MEGAASFKQKGEGLRGRGDDGVNKVCRAGMVERSESFPAIFLASQRVFLFCLGCRSLGFSFFLVKPFWSAAARRRF